VTSGRTGIVHSVLEATAEDAARAIADVPPGIAFVEIRADHLRAPECAGLVGISPVPVIVTVREASEGGSFAGSASEKRGILECALDAGAAFVDVEEGGAAASLAEGAHAGRTILSHHGARCEPGALLPLLERMRASRAARLKIVPQAARAGDVAAVRALLLRPEARGRLAAFASGRSGAVSRALALAWGSWGTYGATARGRESAPGQLTTSELLEVYRAPEIGEATRRFALVGSPVLESPSPAIHAAGYRAAGIDAVYLPVEATDLDDLDGLGLAGFAVTTPLKGAAAQRCATLDRFSRWGAVNTVRVERAGWSGYNTDVPAAIALVSSVTLPAGARIAVVGAGDAARSIAGALASERAEVTLYARDPARAEAAARVAGARAAPLSSLPDAAWEVLVQATPLGRRGERLLPPERLGGRAVLDLAYGIAETPLVRDARARGLVAIDGHAFLLEQALVQFFHLTGVHPHRATLAAALDAVRGAA
jgi:shikimate dehydrogenase/3-dehydroquinate dehydratase type I